MRVARRSLVLLAAATVAGGVVVPPSTAGAADDYRAEITRTEYGIPHVEAGDFGSLGFGHGYANAETGLCNLADTLLTARGERSKYLGPDARYEDQVQLSATNLEVDVLVRDLRKRQVVEKLLADPQRGPSADARAMLRGYAEGVNRYLDKNDVTDPDCQGAAWLKSEATELDLWYGTYLANMLASTGVFTSQIVQADPPTLTEPGLPGLPTEAKLAKVPEQRPSAKTLRKKLGKDTPFGSNATAVGSDATSTGRGMLLGNPHFPWRGRYRFDQVQLTIPGEYDVAGASLMGSPVVNIGWNSDVAWSHTVSTAYRFTPYEYPLVPGLPTKYVTDRGVKNVERRDVAVPVKGPDGKVTTVTEDVYRTPQGYVIDAPDMLMGWTPLSMFAIRDANAEHLRIIDTFLDMGRAKNVRDLLKRQDEAGGMPWVNTTATDREGNALYADHSVVPNVPDDLVDRCITPIGRVTKAMAGLPALNGMHAESKCQWRTDPDSARPGVFGPSNLPDTVRKDWVANANDSYWLPHPDERLEGYAEIIGCEGCERTLRTRMVYRYVQDQLDGGGKVSHKALKQFQHGNRVFGAELARNGGDLQKVCKLAQGGEGCDVLAEWDGRSDADSVGPHIFHEFFKRAATAPALWEVPFDAADPLNTPRDLNEKNPLVIKAMSDALKHLRDTRVPYDATWGDLQVAADDGAPPIPLGGGDANEGNANVLVSRNPLDNTDRPYPITYGSSHIQAVAFDDDGVRPSTILTYGQATDRTSPHSSDQTELFSQEKWVDFPFTAAEIDENAEDSYTVTG